MRLFDDIESAGAVFGGVAPGVEVLADEGTVWSTVISFEDDHRDDLIQDPWQFQGGFGSVKLR